MEFKEIYIDDKKTIDLSEDAKRIEVIYPCYLPHVSEADLPKFSKNNFDNYEFRKHILSPFFDLETFSPGPFYKQSEIVAKELKAKYSDYAIDLRIPFKWNKESNVGLLFPNSQGFGPFEEFFELFSPFFSNFDKKLFYDVFCYKGPWNNFELYMVDKYDFKCIIPPLIKRENYEEHYREIWM